MDATTEALTPKFNLLGLILAIVGGAIAAGITGYLYFLIANKLQIDYILVVAIVLGVGVGAVVGLAGKLGRLRMPLVVFIVAFVFGMAGYVVRYYLEYNDVVETVAQQQGLSHADVMSQVNFGDFMGFIAESGFSIGGESSATSADAPIQGGLAWALLGVELLAAGVAAGLTARSMLREKAAVPAPPSSTPVQM
jgi:hypothetical protein